MATKAFWSKVCQHDVVDWQQLYKLYLEASKEAYAQGPLTFFIAIDEQILTIGLGREKTVLTFNSPFGNWISVGGQDGDEVEFKCLDDHAYYSGENLIPIENAIKSAKVFLQDKKLPDSISWAQV